MNISTLLSSSLLGGQTDATAASSTSSGTGSTAAASTPALRALQASDQRLQTQFASASTQISSLGQLQSALSGVQAAATSLAGLNASTSNADTSTAITGFVTAFNSGVAAAKTASTGGGDQLLQTAAARRTVNLLGRTVAGHRASDVALKAIGVRQGTDGTLTVDPKALAAAQAANPALVRSTLAALGAEAGKSVSTALASGGAVATSISALDARAKALQSQYGAVLKLEQDASTTTAASLASSLLS